MIKDRPAIIAAAAIVAMSVSGCGTQLRSGSSQACAPGVDEWLAQAAAQAVMRVPPDVQSATRTGVVSCPTLLLVGVIGGDGIVQLKTSYTSEESEEQVAVRLKNAAGLADWTSFDGGGDCLVKAIDEVPSFLTVTSTDSTFAVTVRRGDPTLCVTSPMPDPGETPL